MKRPQPGSRKDQVGYAILAFACGSLLLAASALSPNAEGFGTHTQFGLDPCGFKMATQLPCPTCGCTTSVALATDGYLLTSFVTQPFGFFFALLTGCIFLIGIFGAWTRQPLGPFLIFLMRPSIMVIFASVLLLSWGWTIWQALDGLA